jgi:hypothetical protein
MAKKEKPYDKVFENKLFKFCKNKKCKSSGCQKISNGKSDEFKFQYCEETSTVIKYIKKKKE